MQEKGPPHHEGLHPHCLHFYIFCCLYLYIFIFYPCCLYSALYVYLFALLIYLFRLTCSGTWVLISYLWHVNVTGMTINVHWFLELKRRILQLFCIRNFVYFIVNSKYNCVWVNKSSSVSKWTFWWSCLNVTFLDPRAVTEKHKHKQKKSVREGNVGGARLPQYAC